jgi:hypothetical protein
MVKSDNNQHGATFININTSVCEQFFSFLTKFRFSLRHFNYSTSTLFTSLIFHLKKCNTTSIKSNAFGLGRSFFAAGIRSHFIGFCVFQTIKSDIKEKQEESEEEKTEETDE